MTEEATKLFWAKVQKSAGCWLWTASVDGHGYGYPRIGGLKHAYPVDTPK